MLGDLEADPKEMRNVLDGDPEIADMMRTLAEKARDDIGDAATERVGHNRRPGRNNFSA